MDREGASHRKNHHICHHPQTNKGHRPVWGLFLSFAIFSSEILGARSAKSNNGRLEGSKRRRISLEPWIGTPKEQWESELQFLDPAAYWEYRHGAILAN